MFQGMTRYCFGLLLMALWALAPSLAAAHGEGAAERSADPQAMENRLRSLEERQAELYHTLTEKKAAGLGEEITQRLTISGLLEVAGSVGGTRFADGTSDAASELALATAQIGFGLAVNEHTRGELSFLFEEDGPVEVDEAAIQLAFGPGFARLGRQYLPFGAFHSHFISDPLTLELGETRETAILAGFQADRFTIAAFGFNGAAEKIGTEDHLRDWGASLTATPLAGLELGGSYLSDLADSNAELLVAGGNLFSQRVGGWSAFANLDLGPVAFAGEVLGATTAFAVADLDADGDGRGDLPLAWNLEFACYPRQRVELALRYGGSADLAGFPRRQYGANVSWSPWEHTSLALEYLRGRFVADFGHPVKQSDLVSAQLAVAF